MADDASLVEADALLEEGDPRGELILIQTGLENGGFDRARGIALRRREKELLDAHGKDWAPSDAWLTHPILRRGVVVGGTVDAATFIAREAEIARRYPHFSHVRLAGLSAEGFEELRAKLERVLASGRVTGLELDRASAPDERVESELVRWLADSGHLTRLSRFGARGLDRDAVTLLLSADTPFTELGLSYLRDDALLAPFATTKQRPRRLTFVARDDEAVAALVRSAPFFQNVEDLMISLPPRLVPRDLPALRVLRFFWAVPEGMTALMASPLAMQLEALELRRGQHGFEPKLGPTDWDGVLM